MAEATKSSSVTPMASAPPGALGEAVAHAVGGGGAAQAAKQDEPEAPTFAPGTVPQRPSMGAVQSALGRVTPEARNCLNPDDPISRATVTFVSLGNTSSVVVTGHAAGTPAEACIKAALGKAKVPPFAQDSFSAPVTIRPN
jgi:hypothetical protein